ncbi:benenodin family lasso peptide [Novosphingobium sp. KA1]|nr:benenodin family lasso peptide [Novosphingobium sp. KA1]
MHRNDEHDADLLELGTASVDTKGPPLPVAVDIQGAFGTEGLNDE